MKIRVGKGCDKSFNSEASEHCYGLRCPYPYLHFDILPRPDQASQGSATCNTRTPMCKIGVLQLHLGLVLNNAKDLCTPDAETRHVRSRADESDDTPDRAKHQLKEEALACHGHARRREGISLDFVRRAIKTPSK